MHRNHSLRNRRLLTGRMNWLICSPGSAPNRRTHTVPLRPEVQRQDHVDLIASLRRISPTGDTISSISICGKLLLLNYESFLRAFFEMKSSEQVKETRQYDLKVFKLSVETLKGLESRNLDPFVVMEKELEKSNKKGKRFCDHY